MHRRLLLQELSVYANSKHIFEEEKSLVDRFINFMNSFTTCFDRANPGHITGSIWIVNHNAREVLLTHHKKLNLWIQLGGHADGETDIKKVALQEAQEESGITHFSWPLAEIFDIDIHPIPGPCTYHYDVRYLLQAPVDATIQVSDESHDLAWANLSDMTAFTQERSILRMAEKCKGLLTHI